MTTPPPEARSPLVTPTTEETRAINNALTDEEIRELAKEISRSGSLGFDPTTILKGVITAINDTSSPPTLSIQISGDTATTVSQVRLMGSYAPQVDHTVLIAKQGPDLVVLGNINDVGAKGTSSGAGNWTVATLSSGSHNGNGNGSVAYRRILDHGAWKMQWRGGWNVSGTTIISSLPTEFRPSARCSLLAARDSSGSNVVKIDFNTNGSVVLVGTTTTPFSASGSGDVFFASVGTTSASTSSTVAHSHGGAVATANITHNDGFHSHSASHDHGFTGGSHSHSVSSPDWVSFNGLEYFL